MGTKLGVGIITCDRPDYFSRCIASLPEGVGTVVVVNDGAPYADSVYPPKVDELIQHPANRSVGISKNDALRYLLQDGCDYLFIMEDDTEILRPDVFETYIRTAEVSGLRHLNFGPGSPFNRRQTRQGTDLHDRNLLARQTPPDPRAIIPYPGGVQVALYLHAVGMFSFFGRDVLEQVGLHDEAYVNAWEHVDLTYRIIKAGMHPPFWWFADVWDSSRYLGELEGALDRSTIARDRKAWEENLVRGREHYRQVHGHYPNELGIAPEVEVKRALNSIRTRYARC